jgi:exopolyphosphatase/guanosine-5'-triphosphate,3'-diphosphate pyrophosphatase
MVKAAVVDIGTNSVKMVIGSPKADGTIDTEEVPPVVTRLGKGVDKAGQLSEEAIQRTLNTLREFAEEAKKHGVTKTRAVGTSALRDAQNGAVFIAQAEHILGSTVEVISGNREADLIYRAAEGDAKTIAPHAGTLVTTDVGGGSTEVVVGQSGRVIFRQSLQWGAVRLTERILSSDPPTETEIHDAIAATDTLITSIHKPTGNVALIASGGTAANIGAIRLAPRFAPAHPSLADMFDSLHGLSLSVQDIEEEIRMLSHKPLSERRQVPGLEPERADVIIGGAIIQARLLHHLGISNLVVSVHGLRYGLLYEMLG